MTDFKHRALVKGNTSPEVFERGGVKRTRTSIGVDDEVLAFFVEMLKLAIEQSGKTKTEFAAWIGISVQTLDNLRRGDRQPTLGLIMLLYKKTGCTPNWFLLEKP